MELQQLDGDYRDFGLDSTKGDERLAVRFFKKAARDDGESDKQGRMVFREVVHVQIMVPGDRDNILIRPAGEGDKRRFGKQFEAFERGDKEQVIGTPLEMWGRLNLAQVEEFRYIGVRTVEQLAELRDDAMLKMPGATELKRKAQAFLQLQKDEAPMRELQAALESRDKQLEEQSRQLREMQAQLAELAAQQQTARTKPGEARR